MAVATNTVHDKASSLLASVDNQHMQVPALPGTSDHPLAAAAEAEALTSAVGTIAFAGQYASGSYAVQFNRDDGHGFSSTWPEWAYRIAKDSLAANKRVWVAANGDPFGSNLVFVLMYAY